jgi:hypothetical protein
MFIINTLEDETQMMSQTIINYKSLKVKKSDIFNDTPRNGSVWSGSGSVFATPDSIRHRIDFLPDRIESVWVQAGSNPTEKSTKKYS